MKIRIATSENEARFHHYAAVVTDPRFEWLGTIEGPFDDDRLGEVDAFIVSCDQYLPSRLAIAACGRLGIPVFHILDGVIDWRTTFENPKFDPSVGGIPLFQPLIADHVFAMGELQKQEMEWLGNRVVCATGFPRFDRFKRQACRVGEVKGRPRILVATANTPWVTESQEDLVTEEFRQLIQNLQSEGDEIEFSYRISKDLADEIEVVSDCRDSVAEALKKSDVVITTPSTIAVEAMLAGVPTLIFDPFAFPVFTPSAWSATDWKSVLRLMPTLLSPTQELASYQDQVLRLLVTEDQNAAARIVDIISAVVEKRDIPSMPASAILESSGSDRVAAGLSATVTALEKNLQEMSERVEKSEAAMSQPDFQFIVKSVCRYLKNLFKGHKTS